MKPWLHDQNIEPVVGNFSTFLRKESRAASPTMSTILQIRPRSSSPIASTCLRIASETRFARYVHLSPEGVQIQYSRSLVKIVYTLLRHASRTASPAMNIFHGKHPRSTSPMSYRLPQENVSPDCVQSCFAYYDYFSPETSKVRFAHCIYLSPECFRDLRLLLHAPVPRRVQGLPLGVGGLRGCH
jgi:hypothetical protein